MTRFGETEEEIFEPEAAASPEAAPSANGNATGTGAEEPAPEPIPIETAAGRAILEAARRLAEDPEAQARLKAVAAKAYGSFALRPLGPDLDKPEDALLFRSRNLDGAANEEITHLVAGLGVRSIYDIRSTDEMAGSPQLFPLGTKTVALHPTGSSRPKEAERWLRAGRIKKYGAPGARMQANYRRYVDDYPIIGAALRAISTEAVPALVHCTQGKDRTGVLSAVILYAAGASWDTILIDYLATNYVNADLIAADAVRLGEGMDEEERAILMSFLTARPSYLAAFFDEAERRYGSLERYLTEGLRLSQAQRVNLAVMARTDLFAD
ncbi:MAG: tyrosine-protein phosphatase, partial [Eggerthellaceae bacterium]|nr:tyrosine-protein phosphatase [Eggerthellaceae bacterium]